MSDILKIKDKATGLWQSIIAIKGDTGDDGFSPTASVTQTQSGATISITDKSGTTTADISNGDDYVLTAQDKQDIADLVKSEFVDGNSISY